MKLHAIPGGEGVPPEPDWTSIFSDELDQAIASEHWGIVMREMAEAGTLSLANGHAIKRLATFRVMYERAAAEVAETGAVTKAKKTRVPQYNPHWIVMRQADDSQRAIEADLGVAPVRRSKAGKAMRRARMARASDTYLKSK